MAAQGFETAIVITQFFHVSRSKYALRRAGIETVHATNLTYFEWRNISSIAREALALPAHRLTGLKPNEFMLLRPDSLAGLPEQSDAQTKPNSNGRRMQGVRVWPATFQQIICS